MLKRAAKRLLSLVAALTTLVGSTPALGAVTNPAATSAAGVPVQAGTPIETVLANGLKVVMLEDHSYPVVSCSVWYHVGSRNEQPGLTGLSHVVEHLLFQDVGKYKNGSLSTVFESMGAHFNGYTSDDFTTFYEVVSPSALDFCLRAEASRMRSVTFKQSDLKAEVARVQKELSEEKKDSFDQLNKEVRATAFRQHPYKNPISGWSADLDNLTIQDVSNYYDLYYYPSNATLVLIGDFSSSDTLALASKYFGALAKGPALPPSPKIVEPVQHAERRIIMKESGKQDLALISYHAPEYSAADAPAMVLIEKMMNAHYNGRLKKELVDLKICSMAKSEYEMRKDPSLFSIYLWASTGISAQRALDQCDVLINKLKTQAISEPELTRAKNQAEYALVTDRDGPFRLGFHLGLCESLQSWQTAFGWGAKIRAVSSADVQRAAKRYLVPESRIVALLSAGTSHPTAPSPHTESGAAEKGEPKAAEKKAVEKESANAKKKLTPAEKEKGKQKGKEKDSEENEGNSSKSAKSKKSGKKSSKKGTPTSKKHRKAEAPSDGPRIGDDLLFVKPKLYAYRPFSANPTRLASLLNFGDVSAPNPITWRTAIATNLNNGISTPINEKIDVNNLDSSTMLKTEAGSSVKPDVADVPIAPRASLKLPITQRQLVNGIKLTVYESHMSPVVEIFGVLKGGSAIEPTNKRGIATLLAQILNNGSEKQPKVQVLAQQEDIGLPPDAMLKFRATQTGIDFHARCISRDLPRILTMLATTLRYPALSDEDMSRARSDALGHFKHMSDSLPEKVEQSLLRSLLAANSPLVPVDPNEASRALAEMTATDVREFLAQHVAPEACSFTLAGDLEPTLAVRLFEQSIGAWSPSPTFKAKPLPEAQANARRILKTYVPTQDKQKWEITLGKLLPFNISDARFSRLLIANCVLTQHPAFAHLYQRFAQDPILAKLVSDEELDTQCKGFSGRALWSITVRGDSNASGKAVTALQNEMKSFESAGISQSEMNAAKQYLLNVIPLEGVSDSHRAADTCFDAANSGAPPDSIAREIDDIANASMESVNSFVRDEFKQSQSTLVVAGAGGRETVKAAH